MNRIKDYFQFSIIQRTIILSSISIILIGTVLTAASYYIQGKLMFENLDKQARGVAQMAFGRFELKDIKEILTNHDLNSDVHQRILKEITKLSKENPNIAQIVIVDIGVNNDDESMALAIHKNYLDIGMRPGDLVEQNPIFVKLYKEIARTGKMKSSGIYSDILGEWSSILIPIKDEQGKVIAMFVMDFSASEIRDAQLKMLTRLASAFTLLLIFSIIIQTLALRSTLAPLKLLLTAVKELGQGNFSIQLKINRKDDLGQLAEGFNSAVTNIKSLISKVISTAHQVTENTQAADKESETDQITTDEFIQTAILQMNMIEDNYANLKVFSKTLEQYSKRIEELTILEERSRLSKDMHDTVGHVFTAIITSLDALPFITNKEEANLYIKELANLARKGLTDVRNTIHHLSIVEKEQTFLERCTNLVDEFIKHTGTKVTIRTEGNEEPLGDLVRYSLVRCVQESLTNAKRHGHASQVSIYIKFFNDAIQMQIKDNGIGIEDIKYGFGLSSMSDRMRTVGGTFKVQSELNLGTTVTCTVPVPKDLHAG
ncbi:ATP-binding protein [Bacillus sp. OK048]|uniref:sensor histidine kinase n=1 Tax=Bacillus sp. OK048 TaxID=1882761 RepID=UPI000891D6A3|nr:ATP-binding protein [Bacillus sp. OK048]SDM85653.1 Histidine kinase-, DNA gyrase B-, and HSP90-like ATPase [Bacillus sp. OK048]